MVDYLHEAPADLLVVATEGRDGVARWLHGSVAEAMARRSRTMTLFVPAEAGHSIVSLADGHVTLNNVLIPVDHAPDASEAIEFARRVAEVVGGGNVTITLLYVGAEADVPRVHAEDGAGWTFTRMRREGDPVKEILAATDLVGRRAHRDADRRRRGCRRGDRAEYDGARVAAGPLSNPGACRPRARVTVLGGEEGHGYGRR